MNLYRKFSNWLFKETEGERSRWDIIVWWELRRVPYNIIVGAVGICSLFLIYFFASNQPFQPGEEGVEPLALFGAPVVFNLCYTAGWIVEAFFPETFLDSFLVERQRLGPKFLRSGLWLSFFMVLLPAVFLGISWVRHIAGLSS